MISAKKKQHLAINIEFNLFEFDKKKAAVTSCFLFVFLIHLYSLIDIFIKENKIIVMKKLLMAFVILSLASCSPGTQIVKIWQAPGAVVVPNSTTKTLVIALVKNEDTRRIIENQLLKRFKNNAVASYTILPHDSTAKDPAVLAQKIQEGHFTYVLIMRLSSTTNEVSYVPSTTSINGSNVVNLFYGNYYTYAYGAYTDPGHYATTQAYTVETTVYSVDPNKLIWACTTQTAKTGKIDKVVNSVADAVIDAMENNGFL